MRPSLALNLVEAPRMAGEFAEFAVWRRVLGRARHGDGHHVLVLPGLMAGDYTTAIMRNYLASLDYQPHGWGIGRNIGPTRRVVDSMRASVEALTAEHGPISLVGWSMGGLYARQLARTYPDRIRQVVTMGSPFRMMNRSDTLATLFYNRYRHLHVSSEELDLPENEHLRDPLPVPTTSIYSRSDGVVPWAACLNELVGTSENIEVKAAHIGMGHHPPTLWALADRLAQQPGQWRPFKPPRSLARWYPTPVHWPLDSALVATLGLPPDDLANPVEGASGSSAHA